MNKFIYIHGWGSSGIGDTASLFKTLVPGLIAPTLDYYKPAEALETLLALVDQFPEDDVYIIASSLGGFFAENVAVRRVVHVIFYNPSLRPYEVSRIDPAALPELRELALSAPAPSSPSSTRSVVLCYDDDIVLPEYAAGYFHKYDVVWSSGGHRMTTANAESIVSILNKKINYL